MFFEEVLRTAVDALPSSTLVGHGQCRGVTPLAVRMLPHRHGDPALTWASLPSPATALLTLEHYQFWVPLAFPLILGCQGRTRQPKGLVPQSIPGLARCSVGVGCWMQDAVLVLHRMEHRVACVYTITASLMQPRGGLMAVVSRSTLPGQGSWAQASGV